MGSVNRYQFPRRTTGTVEAIALRLVHHRAPLTSGVLRAAARTGILGVMRLCLAAGVSPADTGEYGRNALHAASEGGQLPAVRLMLAEGGMDVNIADRNGCTALTHACRAGSVPVAHALLKAGAQLDAAGPVDNGREFTDLGEAAHGVHADLVTFLLDRGADIKAGAGRGGGTALHAAACPAGWGGADLEDMLRLLLSRGADIAAVNGSGETALHVAALHDWPSLVEVLLAAGAAVNVATPLGQTPLHFASMSQYADDDTTLGDVARLLIDAGAELDAVDLEGFTPLLRACAVCHTQAVEVLLAAGANPAAVTADGRGAVALADGDAEVLALLAAVGVR